MTVVLFATTAASTGPLNASTPIIAAAGGLITANADGPPALGTGLTAALEQLDGTVLVAAALVTITETDLGNGTSRYTARLVAPLTPGSYQIVWQGPEPGQTAAEPVVVEQGVRPSTESVAALLRARTKIKGGSEAGTFTSQTRPTDVQVEDLIDEAEDEVGGKVQPIDPSLPPWVQPGDAYNAPGSPYERRIRRAVALYTAILIELSYFPEQVGQDKSPLATYQQLYDERVRALIAEGETGRPQGMGEGASGAGDAPADAAYSFPVDAGGLVGWGTRWLTDPFPFDRSLRR